MKKMLAVTALLLSFAQGGARAEDANVPLDFKVISVEDGWYGDKGVKIDLKDVKKGVFITAVGGWSTTYPKTTQLLKELFVSKGIHVVDKVEDADIGLQFLSGNRFPGFEAVEEEVAATPPGQSSALAYVTNVAFYKATHGSLLAIAGNEFDAKKNGVGDVGIKVFKNPKLTSRGKLDGDDDKMVASVITFHMNRLPVKEEHYTSMLLTADVSQFIDQHFVGLPAQPATATPASGVAPASVAGASAPVAAN